MKKNKPGGVYDLLDKRIKEQKKPKETWWAYIALMFVVAALVFVCGQALWFYMCNAGTIPIC